MDKLSVVKIRGNVIEDAEALQSFLIDFAQINFLNSFAVGQLVEWHNQLEIKHATLAVAGTNDHIRDIFMVLGVDHIIKTYNNLEEAKLVVSG